MFQIFLFKNKKGVFSAGKSCLFFTWTFQYCCFILSYHVNLIAAHAYIVYFFLGACKDQS